jgi:hypothetical protein
MFTGAKYARSGDVNIAYQVVGDGPIDLVLVLGWVSHLKYVWELPAMAAFLNRLASFSRLILFDKRGCGCLTVCTPCPPWSARWTTSGGDGRRPAAAAVMGPGGRRRVVPCLRNTESDARASSSTAAIRRARRQVTRGG